MTEGGRRLSALEEPCLAKRPRIRIALFVAALVVMVLALFVYLHKERAPEAARLLPESQGILYFNLRPLRAATHFDRRPVQHAPDYQRFIDATGIDFERDLDEAAFALHRLPDATGPNGGLAYSEVFVGHFDGNRLTRYLEASAADRESYAGHTIYSIANQGRTDRVALLGRAMVSISNAPTSEQIHSILDKSRMTFLPTSGSTLLAEHYKDLPLLSLAWGLGQIGLPFGDNGEFRVMGLTLPWRLDATFIASLRWTGALRVRVEEIAPNATTAAASAQSLDSLISIGKMAENALPSSLADENIRQLLNSATVVHYNDRAVLNATLPDKFFQKLVTTPDAAAPVPSSPTPH